MTPAERDAAEAMREAVTARLLESLTTHREVAADPRAPPGALTLFLQGLEYAVGVARRTPLPGDDESAVLLGGGR